MQLDLFTEEKVAAEAAARLSGFNKMQNPQEYIKQETTTMVNMFLDTNSVEAFLELLSHDNRFKVFRYFDS